MKDNHQGRGQAFLAMLLKNFILLKRGWKGTLIMIGFPFLFVGFLVILIKAFHNQSYPERIYVDTSNMVYTASPSAMQPSFLKNCSKNSSSPWGTVALGPSNNPVALKLQTKLSSIGFKTKMFESNQEIDAYVKNPYYGGVLYPTLCFGAFVNNSGTIYEISMRYNITIEDGDGPSTLKPDQDIAYRNSNIINPSSHGILNFQNMIVNYIGHVEIGSTFSQFRGAITSTTVPAMVDNTDSWAKTKDVTDPMIIIPLIGIYLHLVSTLLTQKENRIKQTMKIMGLTNFTYYSTWFITYFLIGLITNLGQSGIIVVGLSNVSFALVWLLLTLFNILLIVQGFFIQVFFSRSKIGIIAATIFFAIQYLISFVFKVAYRRTYGLAIGVSIVPHAALSIALQELSYTSSASYYMGFKDVYKYIYETRIIIAFVSLTIHIIVWTLLFLYLEEVIPNEWGLKRHPCFFLDIFKRKKKSPEAKREAEITGRSFARLPSSTETLPLNNYVRLTNVRKQFISGKQIKVAVVDLSFTLVTDQVFVLLGHNGAGKSTTISMMTGMSKPTAGRINIFGYDSVQDIDKVRRLTGVCFQYNALYDRLTVQQNLMLFGMLKGANRRQVKQQIERLLKVLQLSKKADSLVGVLSGGQKRKVCVAVAFIGGSKLVYLDQPTSGIDPKARTAVWQLLQNYRKDRVIILTTHFMDQAQIVADKIGIMVNGQMRKLSDSATLKKNFGYSLTLVKQNVETNSRLIFSYIRQFVPDLASWSDISLQVNVQMSPHYRDQFRSLLQTLDTFKAELGIASYRISQSSLEDVFLAVIRESHYDERDEMNAKENTEFTTEEIHRRGKSWRHFKATVKKRCIYMKRDITGVVMEFFLPWLIVLLSMLIIKSLYLEPEKYRSWDTSLYASANQYETFLLPISGNISSQALNNITKIANSLNYPYSFSETTFAQNATQFNNNTISNLKEKGHGGLFFVNDTFYYAIVNTTSINSALVFPFTATEILLNKQSPTHTIRVKSVNRPFKPAYGEEITANYLYGALFSLAALLAISLRFSATIYFIVKQKQDRCKFQQEVSGMVVNAYWLGNYLYDYLAYLIAAIALMVMFYIFDITLYTEGEAAKAMWIITILYGLANVPFTYLFSHLFNDYGLAQVFTYDFNIAMGTLMPLFVVALRISKPSLSTTLQGIAWIFRMVPSYCYGETIILIAYVDLINYFERYLKGKKEFESIFQFPIALSSIVSLSWQAVGYFIILIVFQRLAQSRTFVNSLDCLKPFQFQRAQDQRDVAEEREAVLRTDLEDRDGPPIVVKELGKVYKRKCKKKIAVKEISFRVHKGNVFGLLGINGAGKTTTFKMLTSEVHPTQGNAYFEGLNVNNQQEFVRKIIGYCPQFDALLEKFTVRQQLEHYYEMKNLPIEKKDQVVKQKMSELRLTQFENAMSGTLSGGNKRRLSLACAIMGKPRILLLDEPSTGMDPEGRRFMWKIISQLGPQNKNSSVILTTHSMDEADALSTRLGIMANCMFCCIGTPQQIKSKYQLGCQIQIKIQTPSDMDILVFLQSHEMRLTDLVDTIERIQQVFVRCGWSAEQIHKSLTSQGSAQFILAQLEQKVEVSVYEIARFIIVQELGWQLARFINIICNEAYASNIRQWEQIDHFDAYYTFRLSRRIPAWKIFLAVETHRQPQKIAEYSIRQVSLQAIFNKLAGRAYQRAQGGPVI